MAFEHERAQIQRRAVLREPPVRTFWQILRTQERDISVKTIAQGMPDWRSLSSGARSRDPLAEPVCSCAFLLHNFARETAGAACTRYSLLPHFSRDNFPAKLRELSAPRDRETISRRH